MPLILKDRVKDTTTTTGTGTITLSGTAPTGYQNFSAIGNGNTTYYTISGGNEWEVGIGTYSSTGPTLSRDTVLESSNAGALVPFSAGSKDVFVTYPAEKAISDGYGTLPAANGGTGLTSPGTSGNVLTSNGSAWVSSAPSTGQLVLISTANASGASTVDFTGLSSTYIAYVLYVSGLYASTGSATLQLRTTSNGGSTWDSGAGNYAYNYVFINNSGTVTGTSTTSTSIATGLLQDSTYGDHFTLTLNNPGVSRPASVEWTLGTYITSGYQYRGIGFRVSTTAIDGLRLLPSTGTLTGTFKLYGVKA